MIIQQIWFDNIHPIHYHFNSNKLIMLGWFANKYQSHPKLIWQAGKGDGNLWILTGTIFQSFCWGQHSEEPECAQSMSLLRSKVLELQTAPLISGCPCPICTWVWFLGPKMPTPHCTIDHFETAIRIRKPSIFLGGVQYSSIFYIT